MNKLDFLNSLKEKIGGNIENTKFDNTIIDIRSNALIEPVYKNDDYNGYFIKLSFSEANELIIDINKTPPFLLLIEPENFISRTLDKIGLSAEIKINREEFDKKYQIKNLNKNIADSFFTDEVIEKIDEIYPFIFLKFTYKEYRVMKAVDLSSYNTENVLHDIDSLITLSMLAEKQ